MDYDGANQHQITHLGTISLSPRISPDGSRLAFSSLLKIRLGNSDVLHRPEPAGFASRTLVERICPLPGLPMAAGLPFLPRAAAIPRSIIVDQSGGNMKRLTTSKGPDVSPAWNPQDGSADRLGQRPHRPAPDLHHGSRWHQHAANDRRRLCGLSGVVAQRAVPAVFLDPPLRAGRAGGEDIYIMDIASKQWVQLTHDGGRNDFPVGRRMAGTSFFSPAAQEASRSGPCWPTGPTKNS